MSSRATPRAERPVIVMGVSGAGKSTVGALLAARSGRRFVDADDLHPAASKAKMAAGLPLDDADRAPWLALVGACLAGGIGARGAPVVACSALKRAYRDVLRAAAPDTVFIQLDGDRRTLAGRLATRSHEFMPAGLLNSQLEALEPLAEDEAGFMVDIDRSVADIVDAVAALLEEMTNA